MAKRRSPPLPATAPPLPAIEVLNGLPAGEFTSALAPLFEGAPRFLGRLTAARPFMASSDLFERALDIALSMPEAEQIELINAHPRLGAPPRSVSAMSYREQGYDPTDARVVELMPTVGTALAAQLARLNVEYEARFGFRYCVFVNGRRRAALLNPMSRALNANRAAEIQRALTDVVAIAADRASPLEG